MKEKERITEIMKTLSAGDEKRTRKSDITKEYLIIDVGGTLLGVQVEYLREVIDLVNPKDIIPVPFSPSYILGIINIRGEIVPVLSVHEVLGLKAAGEPGTKMVVIDEKFKIAILIRDIVDLRSVELSALRPIKDAKRSQEQQMLFQEFEHDGESVIVIDILRLYVSSYLV